MSVAELLPSIQLLPREEKEQLYRFLGDELARGQRSVVPDDAIVLRPEDQCPYTPEELARMRQEEGGRSLSEIWRRLGRT